MDVLLALAASLLFAIGTVVQQTVAAKATDEEAMQAGFLLRLARQSVWLAGIAVDALGFVCQAIALGVGRISVVQPLLATTVVFALPLGARYSGQRIGPRQILGAGAVAVGLGGFLLVGDPAGGRDNAPLGDWVVAAGILVAVSAALVLAARGRHARLKATLLGTAAGVLFGLSAALTKAAVDQLGDGVVELVTHWQLYGLIAVGWASMTLNEASLQTGELAPALATATVGIGVSVLALAVAAVGIVVLSAAEQPPVDTAGTGPGRVARAATAAGGAGTPVA